MSHMISKAIVDSNVREAVIKALNLDNLEGFTRCKQKFLTAVEDENGVIRRVEVSIKVGRATDKEGNALDGEAEIEAMLEKQKQIDESKALASAKRAEKAEADKAKREAKKKKGEEGE